ncbi:MAG: NAD(P)H-binding protein, partial [Gammaproteobacteria bacterium]|nr:NAD(P)H-binding protein [Gammaproteobacteria bacterium]
MRILVVGATGMLGQPVVRRLLADGYQVRALARNVAAARTLLGTQVEIVAGDVLQPDSLLSAMAQCDVVYASLRGGDSLASCDRVERGGMQNIATAALRSGVRRLACLSGSG